MPIEIEESMKKGDFSDAYILPNEKINSEYERMGKVSFAFLTSLFEYLPDTGLPEEISNSLSDAQIKNIINYAVNGLTKKYTSYNHSVPIEEANRTKLISGFFINQNEDNFIPTIKMINGSKSGGIKVDKNNIKLITPSLEFKNFNETTGTFENATLAKIYKDANGNSFAQFNDVYLRELLDNNAENVAWISLGDSLNASINTETISSDSNYTYVKTIAYKSLSSYEDDALSFSVATKNKGSSIISKSMELLIHRTGFKIIDNTFGTTEIDLFNHINSSALSYISNVNFDETTKTMEMKVLSYNESTNTVSSNTETFDLDTLNGIHKEIKYDNKEYTIVNNSEYVQFKMSFDGENSASLTLTPQNLVYNKKYIVEHEDETVDRYDESFDVLKVPVYFYIRNNSGDISISVTSLINPDFSRRYYEMNKNKEDAAKEMLKYCLPSINGTVGNRPFSVSGRYNNYQAIEATIRKNSSDQDVLVITYINGNTTEETAGSWVNYKISKSTSEVLFSNLIFDYWFGKEYELDS